VYRAIIEPGYLPADVPVEREEQELPGCRSQRPDVLAVARHQAGIGLDC
jgi:hypothetical protein